MEVDKPCHLLRLPAELISQILAYALQSPCPQDLDPTIIPVDWSDDMKQCVRNDPTSYWWGTRRMSALLALTRALHHEAETILYARHRLKFRQDLDANELRTRFLDRISARAATLVRRIGVIVVLDTKRAADGIRAPSVVARRRAFELLAQAFSQLESVEVAVAFVGLPVAEAMTEKLAEQIVYVASAFRDVSEVQLLPLPRRQRALQQRGGAWRLAKERVDGRQWV
jgi:hypothetical protein